MDQNERQIIDDLFERLRKAEGQAGPRDPDAEALIRRHTAAQPAAPYYMAQAIVVQQEALARAQARIQELARQRPAGGFLSGLFGGDETETPAPGRGDPSLGGSDRYRRAGAGGGFLAGAMQTALGVAGGFLIADAIAGLFGPDQAAAAAPETATEHDPALAEEHSFAGEDPDLAGGDLDFDAF